MGKYIDTEDISQTTGIIYNASTTPSLQQIKQYIAVGEARFDNEVGDLIVLNNKDTRVFNIRTKGNVNLPQESTYILDVSEYFTNFKSFSISFIYDTELITLDGSVDYDNIDFSIEFNDSEIDFISKTSDIIQSFIITGINSNEESITFELDINALNTFEVDTEEEIIVDTEYYNFEDITDGYSFGIWLKNRTPLKEITNIQINRGTEFDTNFVDYNTKFYISNSEIGKVELPNTFIGNRQYKVRGVYGYTKEELPIQIKELVKLYVFREIFRAEFFENKNADTIETIDVNVYKEVTRGGSIINGLTSIDDLITQEKGNLKNKLKSYLL